MDPVEPLHAFGQIKLLADPRRLAVLRLLMARPATLTQLAGTLGRSPAWVRHHLRILEDAGLVELSQVRTTGTVTEKYYRAHASAFLLQQVILPKTRKPVVIFAGSHDLALEDMAVSLARHLTMLSMPVGSLDGLVDLRQGLCQLSGAHLLDPNGEYNTPFVRHLFPDRDVRLITLAERTQGLMLAPGNPRSITALDDLQRPNVRFVNRNPGSGTRLWLDAEFKRRGIRIDRVRGYDRDVKTHTEAASLVRSDRADCALGLQAAAARHGLAFIPLFEERYDLVLLRENERVLAPLLDHMQTAAFRIGLNSLPGYNSARSGEQIFL